MGQLFNIPKFQFAYLQPVVGYPGSPVVKNPLALQETQAWSLVGEDPLVKEMAMHSSFLAWKILWTVEPGEL